MVELVILFPTFLHTAMRMMIDMIMMATKARTAANTATWENRAATGKKKTWLQIKKRKHLAKMSQMLNGHKNLFF